MKVITHTDIVSLDISPRSCYEWAEYMIANKASALLPAKISMKPREGVFCNVMPGIVTLPDGSRYGGVKAVTRYPDRVPSLDSKLMLYDAESGEFKAIMDANWITAMRTGAVAAHSVELFAKRDFRTVGIMGLGNAARAAMLVLADRFRDRQIPVKLLAYKGQEKLFAARFCG
ncbi:MAG: hypothetical protein K2H43_02545 [Clostridia bacterium]|nr:hypothetical protein [Clostridia bacterium]